jgi:hypothetical protein
MVLRGDVIDDVADILVTAEDRDVSTGGEDVLVEVDTDGEEIINVEVEAVIVAMLRSLEVIV